MYIYSYRYEQKFMKLYIHIYTYIFFICRHVHIQMCSCTEKTALMSASTQKGKVEEKASELIACFCAAYAKL